MYEENINPEKTEITVESLGVNSVLQVKFTEFSENPGNLPAYFTPYLVSCDGDIYYIGKIMEEFIPDEYGVLVSKSGVPEENGEDTVKISSKYLTDNNGFYGIKLINRLQNKFDEFYLRPYVIYDGYMNVGKAVKTSFYSLPDVSDVTTLNGWLHKNNLQTSGIIKYILKAQ